MNFDKSLGNIGQYQDDQGVWREVNNEFVPAAAPWDWQMLKAGYHIRVKNDFTAGQILEFEVGGSTLQLQPMALEWTNDLDMIQPVSMPQVVNPAVTNPPSGVVPKSSDGTITWENGYGIGRHFAWECTPRRLNKVLTIDSLASLPAPQQYIIDGGNPVLRLNLIFDPSGDVDIYVDSQLWDKSSKAQTFNRIEFRKGGKVLWSFMPLMYRDSGKSEEQSPAALEKSGNSLYISIRVPYEWLQNAVYPVFIDADVAIETNASGFTPRMQRGGIFWTSPTVGYVIYISYMLEDLKYNKTVDGGASWAGAVSIKAGNIVSFDCWADWQTAGDAGTKIHIAYIDSDTDDVRYIYLDTSTDTVGGDDQIEACQGDGNIRVESSRAFNYITITKTRGGNLAVAFHYQDTSAADFFEFYTSPDATTWTNEASPWEASTADLILLFPGNEADNQDVWAIFWDSGLDREISLKTYDDSGNSWSEQLISGSMYPETDYLQMDGQIRLSDGHLIFAAWSKKDDAAADLMVWDINGAGSITAKTNVITNEAESVCVSVLINQINDDIYVAYFSGTTWESEVKAFYQKSVDGGANWGGEQAMQADAEDDERWISAGCMKDAAGWYGKFQPVWFNNDLNDLFTNTDNGVSLVPAPPPPTIKPSANMGSKMVAAGLI